MRYTLTDRQTLAERANALVNFLRHKNGAYPVSTYRSKHIPSPIPVNVLQFTASEGQVLMYVTMQIIDLTTNESIGHEFLKPFGEENEAELNALCFLLMSTPIKRTDEDIIDPLVAQICNNIAQHRDREYNAHETILNLMKEIEKDNHEEYVFPQDPYLRGVSTEDE